MTSTTSRSKKVLAPLAVLLAAGALAVGSGATFTSASSNSIDAVAAGTLTHTNTKDNQAIFAADNLQPGESASGSLKLTNTGTLPASFSLTEKNSVSGFAAGNLNLKITNDTLGTVIYNDDFGGLKDDEAQTLGDFAPGQFADFTFTVTLHEDADNTQQGKKANAAFSWDAIQLTN